MEPLKGIGLKVVSVLVFVAMQSVVKYVSDEVPAGQIMFFRSVFAIPVIVVWLVAVGKIRSGLTTQNPLGHFLRGLAGSAGMVLGFAALGMLPLPEATAIGYAAPLLVVILAAMFLGERLRLFRMTSVGLGLVGVVVILSPRLSAVGEGGLAATEALGAMIALMAALCSALAQVFVRKLVFEESTSSIVFWFSISSAGLSLLSIPFGWVWPSPGTFALLVLIGLLGGVGQVLLTSCYRFADASVIAPFEYVSMLVALMVGFLVFGEVPTGTVLFGAALVVVAGIVIIWRERQLGFERSRERKARTPAS